MPNFDAHYVIGHSHKVCQDYGAVSKNCAVISDGCSSAEDSDLGSRILSLKALDFLSLGLELSSDEDYELVAANAYNVLATLGKPFSLDATLATISLKDGYVNVHSYGDSVVVAKTDWGFIVDQLEFVDGYPAYPSYLVHPERVAQYKDVRGNVRHKLAHYTNDFGNMLRSDVPYPLNHITRVFTTEEVEWVAIISDGIHSFRDEEHQSLSLETILPELFAFKTFKGEFVHRRMKRYLFDTAKKGWTHYDDLSMAVVKL